MLLGAGSAGSMIWLFGHIDGRMPMAGRFEWDASKDADNRRKHGVEFALAREAFLDPARVIARDLAHSGLEERYYCFGRAGGGILTVRFTYRSGVIRIFGAGYWRRGRRIYEEANSLFG
jgi:uncharacterized DUF497 family protein